MERNGPVDHAAVLEHRVTVERRDPVQISRRWDDAFRAADFAGDVGVHLLVQQLPPPGRRRVVETRNRCRRGSRLECAEQVEQCAAVETTRAHVAEAAVADVPLGHAVSVVGEADPERGAVDVDRFFSGRPAVVAEEALHDGERSDRTVDRVGDDLDRDRVRTRPGEQRQSLGVGLSRHDGVARGRVGHRTADLGGCRTCLDRRRRRRRLTRRGSARRRRSRRWRWSRGDGATGVGRRGVDGLHRASAAVVPCRGVQHPGDGTDDQHQGAHHRQTATAGGIGRRRR